MASDGQPKAEQASETEKAKILKEYVIQQATAVGDWRTAHYGSSGNQFKTYSPMSNPTLGRELGIICQLPSVSG